VEHRVASEADLEAGELMRVQINDRAVCLARSEEGQWFAIADTCTHESYSLSEGDVWGCEVECALHGSRFSLLTGEPDQLPATKPVATYPVTVRDGAVYVSLAVTAQTNER
jgi:3-phenylpropionate/trans-cinnamate dioxygenase ferredoxin component